MRLTTLLLPMFLFACTAPKDDDTDTDVSTSDDDTDVADTDTGLLDTDVVDTDVVDTDALDTDVADTDVLDTDPLDTDVPDTDAPDTDVPDTDVADTDALDTDVSVVDFDGDGTADALDCAPTDPAVHPGAAEECGEELDCDVTTVATCPTTFDDVYPIYRAHCTPCHSTSGSGGHNIASANITTAYSASQLNSTTSSGHTKGFATLVRIRNGSMPAGGGCTGNPVTDAGNSACLTASEQALIQAWIDDGQLRALP